MKKKLVILGAKESGVGAAKLAKHLGYEVFVSDFGAIQANYASELDAIGVAWEQGTHTFAKIEQADLVVISPGIPSSAPVVKHLVQANIPLISEIEFAYQNKTADSKIFAITGSNGKTTTTLLSAYIFKTAGLNAIACGNVGYSFARALVEKPAQYYILELSSFQLDYIVDFCPDVAILLNISPDHLDRYNYNFEEYIDAKFKIIQNQTQEQVFVYNADDEAIVNKLAKLNTSVKTLPFSITKKNAQIATYVEGENIIFKTPEKIHTMFIKDLSLAGMHNLQNAMAAGTATHALDLDQEALVNALSTFSNIEHRMEKVRTYGGVTFINDSKATNINSVWYALESVPGPIIWLVGGVDKGNDYEVLKSLVVEKVDAIICIGLDNRKIIQTFDNIISPIVEIIDMQMAVQKAFDFASPGTTILLSPACSSFDCYKNYEDRGLQFTKAAIRVRR